MKQQKKENKSPFRVTILTRQIHLNPTRIFQSKFICETPLKTGVKQDLKKKKKW